MTVLAALWARLVAGLSGWVGYLILAALIAAGGAYGMHHYIDQPKIDAQNKQIGSLNQGLKDCGASVAGLKAAVAAQNDAAAAAKAAGDKRVAAGEAALQAAQGTIDKLRRDKAAAEAYKRPAGVDECTAARDLVEADNAQ